MKTIEKTITYSVSSKEIASFILNEFDEFNDEQYLIREILIKRSDLGYPIMKVTSISVDQI